MSSALVSIVREGHVATVTFERPEKLNALSRALMSEIQATAESFHDDTETRAVVFTGRGKHFSAGADLSDPDSGAAGGTRLGLRRALRLGPEMTRAILEIPQITIAAVNGVALGGGCVIASACDFRIGASDSACGYPEVLRGMNLQWISLPLCVHLVGPARAKRMIALGNKEDATTLERWGFYDDVVAPAELVAAAQQLARDYAARPPIAVQMIKQSVNAVATAFDRAVMHGDADQWMLTASTDDYREGIRSFFEKREPEFEGN